MPSRKKYDPDRNVLDAAQERISRLFDHFPKLYVSFSGGKDSTCLLHLAVAEARKRQRKIGVLFIDLEGQYQLTIDHINECLERYRDWVEPYWVCLPLNLRNAVSQYEPQWVCWDPEQRANWIRPLPSRAISDEKFFPFFRRAMEFEEFVAEFGRWYSADAMSVCLVGIRSDESLNRYTTVTSKRKNCFLNYSWTTWCGGNFYNAYPIYDWRVEDDWTYLGKFHLPYNALYDRMYQAGLTLAQMRICQPYGDDQRRGLWLFHIIEPDTWAKVVARVNGANQGSIYVQESGNVMGYQKLQKPPGHTWKSFAELLLDSMPPPTREHYANKIAVFLRWYSKRGYPEGIPDQGDLNDRKNPSWTRICKALLRNDYWCKGLSFSQQKSGAYLKYLELMKKRRELWNLI